MPEGPEIRRAADALATVLNGQLVETVQFTQARLGFGADLLSGDSVAAVTSAGKALLISFNSGQVLYSHNQLYGRWYTCQRGALPVTKRTLRVALHTASHSALLYSASAIEILGPGGVADHPYLARLGPDALNTQVQWRDILTRLTDSRFRNRALASLYLDQAFVAGIGNYLRSEILHSAAVHPALKPRDLTRSELGRLARATLAITRRSYVTDGVTNTPRIVAALRRAGWCYEDYRFAVFARAGEPCHRCRQPIVRSTMNSRRLYFCPVCQTEPHL